MVDQSELAFRMQCRARGAALCYSPMYKADEFVRDERARAEFSTCTEDRPLVVQLCGNDAASLVAAARLVEARCDAVDLNLGCPQNDALTNSVSCRCARSARVLPSRSLSLTHSHVRAQTTAPSL